ncbi:fibroblast growth factor receptor 3-like [Lemur catta]|uniref:fibroblast growth factor receptor 3-like n=1 Tax=Lemur catta TaxID=9447 RepID=UPI001E26A906|nr:fibroblast growth factor receptor 3-like [Lemur catta]
MGPGPGPVLQSSHLSMHLLLRHQQWSLGTESVVPLALGHSACVVENMSGSIWKYELVSAQAGAGGEPWPPPTLAERSPPQCILHVGLLASRPAVRRALCQVGDSAGGAEQQQGGPNDTPHLPKLKISTAVGGGSTSLKHTSIIEHLQ